MPMNHFDDGPYKIEERDCGVPYRNGTAWLGSDRHWWVVLNKYGGAEYYAPTMKIAQAVKREKERARPRRRDRPCP